MNDHLNLYYKTIIRNIIEGDVVPFLGAGANLCDRPVGAGWRQKQFLPSSDELVESLSAHFQLPPINRQSLETVAQYIVAMNGEVMLYKKLHEIFDADYPATTLHRILATLPAILRDKGYPNPYQLIITTNYDDMLERAFQATHEPFDLVIYEAKKEHRGKLWHRLSDGNVCLIEKPNEYHYLPFEQGSIATLRRTVILKIHGSVDRIHPEKDSFLITEDDVFDFLTRAANMNSLLPSEMAAKMKRSNFLFLGYGLHDYDLRFLLYQIRQNQDLSSVSWAIQLNPDLIDEVIWNEKRLHLLNIRLEDFVAALNEKMKIL